MKKAFIHSILIISCIGFISIKADIAVIKSNLRAKITNEWRATEALMPSLYEQKEAIFNKLTDTPAGYHCHMADVAASDCRYFYELTAHDLSKEASAEKVSECQKLFEIYKQAHTDMEKTQEFKDAYNALSDYFYHTVREKLLKDMIRNAGPDSKKAALAAINHKPRGIIHILGKHYDASTIYEKVQNDLRTLVEQETT